MAGVLAVGLLGGAAGAETLTDTLVSAYQNSDLLEQNRALLRAADEDVAQAVSTLRPVISFVARGSHVENNARTSGSSASLSLSVSLSLYEGGANKLGIEAAKEAVLGTRAELLGLEQDVLLGAVQAHMRMRSAMENVLLSQSNVRLIQQELRAARDRFEVGEVTRTDVSIAEAALAASRSGLVAAEGNLATAREAFKLAVGRYPGTIAGAPRMPKLPASLKAARDIALRGHPDIIASQHNVTFAELNVARAKAARRPSISAGVDLSVDDHGNDTSSLSLQLTQPIYQGGRLISLERQAVNNREASRSRLHQTVRLIDQAVANAWATLAVARAQIAASDEQIRAAQLAFEGTKEEAKLGSRTTLDVLDAEQDLLDARAARIEAEANQYIAVYSVLAAMGLLTVDHLKLGIATYDPEAYYNTVKSAPLSPRGAQLDRVLKSLGKTQ
ncbi:TolC family outer membrane protein [Actibacterium sp. MT2.3-13A]|uniref:TolC family outer membrane protein n=1 Tax=Actibacterium sp. MT2.3-13A TaxID=2828332 RepID=UPI001BA53D8C|nr:TolC family outer membrane protein [Actibacterium sp. MT2.3-13A]